MLDVDPAARLTLVNMHGRMDQIPPDDGVNQVLVSHRSLVAEIVPQPLTGGRLSIPSGDLQQNRLEPV